MKITLLLLSLAACGCETQYANATKGYTISFKVSPDATTQAIIANRALDDLHGFKK